MTVATDASYTTRWHLTQHNLTRAKGPCFIDA